jgi:tetratricopeptide (TPR) repeat protein
MFQLEKARALVKLNRRKEAEALAVESTEVLTHGSSNDAGRGLSVIGEIYESLGEPGKAQSFYEQAVSLLEADSDRYLLEVYGKLAALHEAEGRPDEALAVLKKAMAMQSPAPAATVSA